MLWMQATNVPFASKVARFSSDLTKLRLALGGEFGFFVEGILQQKRPLHSNEAMGSDS
jgi:hypothetical protein